VSSPITFSGFNNIDFNLVLNGLMQQASQPLTALQSRQRALETQITRFDALSARITALRSAAEALGDAESVATMSGRSSNSDAVAIATGTDAVAGHYDVIVTELARAQVTASTSVAADADTTVVASGGTITIGGVAVSLSGDVTLQGLATAINETDGIGVSAAVVRTGESSYRLVLTSLETGSAHAFTVTNALSGGSGVTFGDFDTDGTSGDSPEDNAVSASDAAILVNNIAATSASNDFEDILPGVSLTVYEKDADATHRIDVAPDSAALEARVEDFVSAYNDLVTFFNDQRTAAAGGDQSSIGRDPLLRQLRNSLRTELLGAHGTEAVTRLAEVGLEFTQAGLIELDAARFREVVEGDGDAVRGLFADATGVFPAIETMLDTFTGSDGVISGIKERLNSQVDAMDRQIEAMQSRLAIQREMLARQFTEADTLMSRLRNQSGSLANLGSSLGGF
jgi:flagellar hook-associated protein 2